MRFRDAKRLSKHKFVKAEIPFDYWLEVQPYQPTLTYLRKDKLYRCEIKTGAAVLVRVHRCAFHLLRIVARVIVDNCVTRFQRGPVLFRPMSNPLSKAVSGLVEERGLRVSPVHGYRHFRPQPLTSLPREHPDVASAIRAEMEDPISLPPALKAEIGEYQHSSTVKDLGRMAPGLVALGDQPEKPLNLEVAWDIFVEQCLAMPFGDDGELVSVRVPEFTAVEMSRQPQTGSSAGLLPLSVADGVTTGSKKTMHDAAIAINLQDKLGDHVPPFGVFKPALKAETIKVGKNVRTILLESQPNYMVLKHYYGPLASTFSDFAGGIAIGMSSRHGDFKTIPFSWWLETGLGYEEFITWLEGQDAHESDKTGWEASTNATDGLPFLLFLLMSVEVHPADRKLVVRSLADYVRPHVQFDIGKVYSVQWRVPSGSYLTSYGNSKRHGYMAKWVIGWLAKHGTAGDDDCSCFVCVEGKKQSLQGWGETVSEEQLRLLSRFFVMGDDFVALNPVPFVFDWVIDFVFGTTTRTVVKPFFSEPGLDAPTGCEFLRRHFCVDRSSGPPVIRTFRAAGRVLGKLFQGGHRHSKERFLAAVDSALNDCGANEPLFRILHNLHFIIAGNGVIELGRYRDALQQYVRKNPLLEFMALGYVPTHADIVNLDANNLDPLMACKKSAACRERGLTPAMYEHLAT